MMNFGRAYSLAIAASLMLSSCNEGGRGNGIRFANDRDEAAATAKTEKLNMKRQRDADFVFETVANQYGEIKLCELAIQRSHNAGIRKAAERLQKDHAASLNALKVLAQAKAVSIPVEEDNDTKRTIERFADESGSEFDKKWCSHMLEMHTESIKKYEKRLDDTADPELKTFLEKNLSILKDHYASLKVCNDKTQALSD
jgi:putative membrane protein